MPLTVIQGLNKLVQDKDAKIEKQEREIAELREKLDGVVRAVAHVTTMATRPQRLGDSHRTNNNPA